MAATNKQYGTVVRNVVGRNDANYSRRIASVVSGPYGSTSVSVRRAQNDTFFNKWVHSNSAISSSSVLAGGLDRLSSIFSTDTFSGSPSTLIGKLRDALHTFGATPANQSLGNSAVSVAQSLAKALNTGTRQIQELRNDADKEIAGSVANINDLLTRFEKLNREIVSGTRADQDVSLYMDQRDGILKQLSEEIGINTLVRGDNDIVIFAENGVTLFETTPRKVSFERSSELTPGVAGNAVLVDGVPLDHTTFDQPYGRGNLSGLLQLRDQIAPQYQMQLDEIARTLVTIFAENDQTGAKPDRTGLFGWSGSPDVPSGLSAGIAGSIKVSSAFAISDGGNSLLLRDGGANGADYKYNRNGATGFSDRLRDLEKKFSQGASFASGTGLPTSSSLTDYSSSSISWLEGRRKLASDELTYNMKVFEGADRALSGVTEVDLDHELSLILDLERSFQASSRVITTVNAMLDQLLRMV